MKIENKYLSTLTKSYENITETEMNFYRDFIDENKDRLNHFNEVLKGKTWSGEDYVSDLELTALDCEAQDLAKIVVFNDQDKSYTLQN